MSKHGIDGTDVYVNKLHDGTEFEVINGAWNGRIKHEDGNILMQVNDNHSLYIGEGYSLTITTESEIPREAYVYDSEYYAFLISTLIDELEFNKNTLKCQLLTRSNRRDLVKNIKSTSEQLNVISNMINELGDEKFE